MTVFTIRSDGWDQVELENWPNHDIQVLACFIDGRPRIIGLHIEPKPTSFLDSGSPLTGEKLRRLPLNDLAVLSLGSDDIVFEALAAVHEAGEPSDSETEIKATTEQVASLYKAAQRAGKPPRPFIKDALHISDRTLDRRIKDARDTGLLEPYRSTAPKPKTKKQARRQKEGK
jgi:hypothetical protein